MLWRAILLLGVLAASPVRAQDAATADVVELVNGGRLRGQVLEYEPGRPLVIRLASGETRSLAPGEVRSVRLGGSTTPEPAPARRPAPAALAPAGLGSQLAAPSGGASPPASPAASAPRSSQRWVLEDGNASRAPWDDRDTGIEYRPSGPFHVGLQARGGAWISSQSGYLLELAALVELRPVSNASYRMRVLFTLGYLGAFDVASVGVRAFPLCLDLGDEGVLRLGADFGSSQAASPSLDWSLLIGPNLEAGLTLFDKRLEILVSFAALFGSDGYNFTPGLSIGGLL